MNIRNLSDKRIASLQSLGKTVVISDLDHMVVDKYKLNLDKAKTWTELAAAERITSEPRRQSADENNQLINLQLIYHDLKKPAKTYLYGGKLITDLSKIIDECPPDLDAYMQDNGWELPWTMKGGQDQDGGAQGYQFENVLKTIAQAPEILSSDKIVLCVLVNGKFWTKPRKKYKNYKHAPPFSLVDLLSDKARHKKCLIFSDSNMPVGSFYTSYIAGVYV